MLYKCIAVTATCSNKNSVENLLENVGTITAEICIVYLLEYFASHLQWTGSVAMINDQ